MAKQSMNLVELAEVITSLSTNEMQTLGKIVMAKQQMNNPGPTIQPQNVPGPAGGPPQQLPPQMMRQQPRRAMPPQTRDAMMPGLLGR